MSADSYGLNSDYVYTEISLDSKDGVATDARFSRLDWPTFYFNQELENIAAVKVVQAEIPFSYYVIDTYNNIFLLSESDGAPGNFPVTIPIGNYDATTLATALATALTATSVITGGNNTYTVTYDPITGKFTFSNNAGGVNTFTFHFGTQATTFFPALGTDSGSTNPRHALGFEGGFTISNSSQVLVAPYVAMVTGPNYVYLNSETLGVVGGLYLPNRDVVKFNTPGFTGGNGPQLAKIPINAEPGEVAFYTDPDPQKWFDVENIHYLSSLDLFCTLGNYTDQRPLKFNGASFSIKLGLLIRRHSQAHMSQRGGTKVSIK